MYALPYAAANGYHLTMADSSFFPSRPAKPVPTTTVATPARASLDALLERDRSLTAIVARMANKDEGALSELFDMVAKRLHSFALRIVRDEGLAEEVTEDALFQAWREANSFDVGDRKSVV